MKAESVSLSHSSPAALPGVCLHCGNLVPARASSQFCCAGCETVFHWVQDRNLGKYYDLKTKVKGSQKSVAPLKSPESFQFLDDPEFLKLYSWETPEGKWMELYIEGVYCAACVWLTEKVADIVDHVGFIRINLGNSVATVRIDNQGSFSAVAAELQKMGYRPHPIKQDEQRELQKRENRMFLIRIGVAGASAGNIMLLAVSLYGGMSGAMAQWFRWTSFVLFLPVICFSAVPFYRSAWSSLRSKEVSIDIPVIFGISLGSLVSIVNLFMGDERVYFDSLSTLVFLLLSTRYLLKRTQQNALDSSRLVHFLTPSAVRKWHANRKAFELVGVNQIQPGDRVQILPNECIPIDGLIDQGSSFLDCAILSGEAQPQKVVAGDLVFAGTFNLDAPIEIRVTQSGSKTRVGRILEEMERLCIQKAPITVFADRVSRYFVAAVVILSAFTFAWGFRGDWLGGMNRALAIAIVTCPCTFALITPLAFTMALGKLARKGVLVKGAEVLEKLARVKHVFLDKTGTLTVGTPQVKEWEVPEELSVPILAIESHSVHPVAKALVKYLQPKAPVTLPHIENLQETMGQGIRALIGEDWVEIRRAQNQSSLGTEISVLKNDVWVGRIVLRDQVREDSKESVARLQSLGLKTGILSGDHRVPVTQVAIQVGIDPTNCFSEASPEAKSEIIGGHKNTLMVGDGANDALALGRADVGIAVHSGVEISLHAADVYLNSAGVRPVYDLVLIARETLRVVRRNFSFSIIYNLIAGGFALAGKIDPLFAAIIMPMSGLTVFISSVIGTSKMRKAFREINV